MQLQEISGWRQLDFVKQFDYIREAGTKGEKKAALAIVEELKRIGIEGRVEEFEFDTWEITEAELTVTQVEEQGEKSCLCEGLQGMGSAVLAGRTYTVAGYGCCGSTPEEGIEAPLLYAENGDDISLSFAKGRIVMLNNPVNAEMYQKLVKAGAAGFVTICGTPADEGEDRLLYTRRLAKVQETPIQGAILHYRDAMELTGSGALRVRLRLKSQDKKAVSRNVIARIEGSSHPEEILSLTAHFDSVPQGPGAYDNMSGCAVIMELCRYFKEHLPARTLEFIWFGGEEKGLLGSRSYVETHEQELTHHRFNMNVDLAGQAIGGTVIGVTGENSICSMLEYLAHEAGIGMTTRNSIWASDSNTFAWKGIPAMTLNRDGFGMHTRHDIVDYISPWSLQRSAQLLGYITEHLSDCCVMPFTRNMPEQFQKELNEYFGG